MYAFSLFLFLCCVCLCVRSLLGASFLLIPQPLSVFLSLPFFLPSFPFLCAEPFTYSSLFQFLAIAWPKRFFLIRFRPIWCESASFFWQIEILLALTEKLLVLEVASLTGKYQNQPHKTPSISCLVFRSFVLKKDLVRFY